MKYYIFFLFFLFSFKIQSQNRYDYKWIVGYGSNSIPSNKEGGMILDFANNIPSLILQDISRLSSRANISDSGGNLIAFTDGCKIFNSDIEIMSSGDELGPGALYDEFCTGGGIFPTYQGQLFLPFPSNENKYILFHLGSSGQTWKFNVIYYSILDASLENGKGKVISKNNAIIQDTLVDYITSTRHANGRDWWVVVPKFKKNKYFKCLVTPEGVKGPWSQVIGNDMPEVNCCGQATFSPDGSKYIKCIPKSGIQVLDFDRCSGQFSNPIFISTVIDSIGAAGAVVSPNGRFLYIPAGSKVWQYDLESSDVAQSRKTVAVYDGFANPYQTGFYQAMSVPSGEIYITCTNTNNYFHIIHNPDEEDVVCSLEQHGFELPNYNRFTVPNFINYRLWDVPGSPCDTLGIDVPPVVSVSVPTNKPSSLLISPNPSTGSFDLTLPSDFTSGKISIFNSKGVLVLEKSVNSVQKSFQFDFSNQSVGFYFISLNNESGKIVSTNKLLIQH
jgi:hypothetical protein